MPTAMNMINQALRETSLGSGPDSQQGNQQQQQQLGRFARGTDRTEQQLAPVSTDSQEAGDRSADESNIWYDDIGTGPEDAGDDVPRQPYRRPGSPTSASNWWEEDEDEK